MQKHLRLNEYKVLFYRIALAYLFYFIARVLFYYFNADLLRVESVSDFLSLSYYGLAFDTTAILYINLLFVVFSILPFWKNTNTGYQKFLFYLYFGTNLLAFATNFIDFIYYKFTFARTTTAALNVLEHETNKTTLFLNFLVEYWYVFALFVLTSALWVFLYKKIKVQDFKPTGYVPYFSFSTVGFLIIVLFVIGGIRGGDFKKSTRPINLLDASRNVKNIVHSDIVLNTPFAIIRTLFSNSFLKVDYPEVNPQVIADKIQPVKSYHNNPKTKPNVVVFILESYGREYIGAFNKKSNIPDYKSHAPFLDSLAQHSMIFTNAYANGRQSIHGMSSVLAGIPSFKDAFTSSPYPKQKIESLVSTLKGEGYNTSFFHGAANGSMGFLGFSKILGIDDYYGRTEFNDDSQFDGFWGIWDEPFLQYMKKTLDTKKTPFFASVFTVSSHEPYVIPEKYKKRFHEGGVPIHKAVEYTDYAVKRFFEEAKKEPWFENTIFVMVADHCNQIYYDEYQKPINRFAVPILIYKPNSSYVGVDEDLAQQIDIYPTILDMIGYDKPFRSWGRSLLDKKSSIPFVINSTGNIYQFAKGNYICTFDGKKALGFYDKEDKALKHNLIKKRNAEMDEIELNCKAFIQDYMERVVDKKLDK
ncbi:LTA synthase family protein [Flavobacterium granuli]|uniref:Phosphoglycerol transferase MdoB n=1 Tax=Flavobacterium granuli TaxID=280093 RepID=A0A1M5QRJ6_9FLAO|nr:alkaline phosphatase family protein [Flavobacterium granuli]PRZ25265.1 phosphoglycerol transferase MdoB-like AlkP superfamily enzyme [Flavobacterium granuli]SHH16727.1 Phosphoglycerol transferase MdoB [Flavobacterium granuli]